MCVILPLLFGRTFDRRLGKQSDAPKARLQTREGVTAHPVFTKLRESEGCSGLEKKKEICVAAPCDLSSTKTTVKSRGFCLHTTTLSPQQVLML